MDLGNLITIGITLLLIIFFRLLDKSNRSLDKVRKYVDRCKDDLSAYVEDKTSVIKDFAVTLDVEKKSAAELMRRIQKLTREDLKEKVEALAEIDAHIQGFDTTLAELIKMHGIVQDNMGWIREESVFVQGVGKQLGDVKEKIASAEAEAGSIGRRLETMEDRFADENAARLEDAREAILAGAQAAIADLESRLEREERRIEALFAEAVEKAGHRADKVEETALAKLRSQAEERLALVKANFEEKLKSFQGFVKTNREDVQELIRQTKEEWEAEAAAINEQKATYSADAKEFKDEWDKHAWELGDQINRQAEEMRASILKRDEEIQKELGKHREEWGASADETRLFLGQQAEEMNSLIRSHDERQREELARQRDEWKSLYRDTGLEIASAIDKRLGGYREAQEEIAAQLVGISHDNAKLEEELRLALKETASRVADDFARLAQEMREAWEGSSIEYVSGLQGLRGEMADLEQGLSYARETAFESISGKLKKFEDEFLEDLSNRSVGIDHQLLTWQEALNSRLETLAAEAERRRAKAETKIADDLKKDFAVLRDRLVSDLEELRGQSAAFEATTTGEMRQLSETRLALSEQLERNLTEARTAMEEVRRESAAMSKAFERSGALKTELGLHDDKLKESAGRLARLDAEVVKFEAQVAHIKRLEDDIHARTTRFDAEKRRIEGMEEGFNRLLRTAQSVEERLTHVSNSDDLLQTAQVKIRQLDDALKDADEKYQRMERKNQILQETTDGINRNFKALQDSEMLTSRLDGALATLKTDIDIVRNSVAALSSENEKTLEAAEKLATLDESIKLLEDRIDEMNKARESVARLATELQNLNREAKDHLKMAQDLRKQPSERSARPVSDEGAPPQSVRANVIRLKRAGWTIEEIARSLGISKGEVELILELGSKN